MVDTPQSACSGFRPWPPEKRPFRGRGLPRPPRRDPRKIGPSLSSTPSPSKRRAFAVRLLPSGPDPVPASKAGSPPSGRSTRHRRPRRTRLHRKDEGLRRTPARRDGISARPCRLACGRAPTPQPSPLLSPGRHLRGGFATRDRILSGTGGDLHERALHVEVLAGVHDQIDRSGRRHGEIAGPSGRLAVHQQLVLLAGRVGHRRAGAGLDARGHAHEGATAPS